MQRLVQMEFRNVLVADHILQRGGEVLHHPREKLRVVVCGLDGSDAGVHGHEQCDGTVGLHIHCRHVWFGCLIARSSPMRCVRRRQLAIPTKQLHKHIGCGGGGCGWWGAEIVVLEEYIQIRHEREVMFQAAGKTIARAGVEVRFSEVWCDEGWIGGRQRGNAGTQIHLSPLQSHHIQCFRQVCRRDAAPVLEALHRRQHKAARICDGEVVHVAAQCVPVIHAADVQRREIVRRVIHHMVCWRVAAVRRGNASAHTVQDEYGHDIGGGGAAHCTAAARLA